MTSTQEPNTMAPQSALCICSRKWKAKHTSCLYSRNGKLDTKWRSRQTKRRKENSRTALDVYSPFTVAISKNVFCQGMVVLLNLVCVLLSGMLHVYKSEVCVAVFET